MPDPVADDELTIRRTPAGWRVCGEDVPELASAMVLADLLAAELPPDESTQAERPPRAPDDAGELDRLRVTVQQLEHALTARVVVEQAIGILAERRRSSPRRAFETLRQAARSRGRRVADLAADVVASATNPLLPLPSELSRQQPDAGSTEGPSPS